MELIRQQYPVGTRIILHHMDDSQALPPGTKGTVAYVDDMGQIGVKWDTGSSPVSYTHLTLPTICSV